MSETNSPLASSESPAVSKNSPPGLESVGTDDDQEEKHPQSDLDIQGMTTPSHEAPRGGPSRYPRPWKTTFFRLAPLAGIGCMLFAVVSLLISFGILTGSNTAPVSMWSVQSSAYNAICTAVANQAIKFAAFQGVVIAWWFRATRGSTVVSREIFE